MSNGRLPTLGDNQQAVVDLLAIIAENTGGLDGDGTGTESDEDTPHETTIYQGFVPGNLLVTESSQMAEADGGGAITVEPGEESVLVEWEASDPMGLLAVGSTDRPDAVYSLVVDGDRKIQTFSPLGLINTPFSFIRQMGAPFPAGTDVEYRAALSSAAEEPVQLAARLFLELDA